MPFRLREATQNRFACGFHSWRFKQIGVYEKAFGLPALKYKTHREGRIFLL